MFYLLALNKFDLNVLKAIIVLDYNITMEGRFKQAKNIYKY